jgi:ABC-type lipoprotein export system ATPase subunit
VCAVDGGDLDVATVEMVGIMGPSECGKSTLLHLLGGLGFAARRSASSSRASISWMS